MEKLVGLEGQGSKIEVESKDFLSEIAKIRALITWTGSIACFNRFQALFFQGVNPVT